MEKEKNLSGRPPAWIGPWMLTSIFKEAMAYGQFPVAVFGSIAIIVALRVPPQELAQIIMLFMNGLRDHSLLGYALSMAAVGGWFYHVSFLKKLHKANVNNIEGHNSKMD